MMRNPNRLPIIFLLALPKSGSTWLRAMLSDLPGFFLYSGNDPNGIIKKHDIFPEYFDNIPDNRYAVIRLHTRYSKKNVQVITKEKVKAVLMFRDLRDVAISRYFFVKTLTKNPHYPLYNRCSIDEGIMHSVQYIFKRYLPWVQRWKRYAEEHPEDFTCVSYEDLKANAYGIMQNVLRFYQIDVSCKKIKRAVQNYTQPEKKKKISTFRKGTMGDWRNFFKKEHIQAFKQNTGNLLIEMGYEQDIQWK